ncbi:D-alanyl-lipoteichoic acid biosynthesis protein DltD [Clostridium botulinum]|uniref:D-alanyl-lipoteichoic acid biosynthesis protein DltD n=1 Tax=Clostridium botulinum TaxID=1491 RepID=UPI001966F7E6|nr:D-alanyl-lipoteichoic acid biosynthesis protein DltD [Clostridium botulinum]MBN1066018.1 D-alanyl-lipoteichoic acid biosynthesis protein DltD [Clostridium botulinum]
MKKTICILCPIIVGILTVVLLNFFLDKQLKHMLNTKDLTEINMEYGSIYKDKGVAYNNYIVDNEDIILQATSELNVPVEQLPNKFFPIQDFNNVITMGRQGSQSLTQLSMIGSHGNNKENRKIALVVSLQWFYNKEGVAQSNFQGNFAPVQFYNLLNNEKISQKNKKEYAARVNYLLTGSSEFLAEKIYAKIYSSNNNAYKVAKLVFAPYFIARENMVNLKDKGLLFKKIRNLPEKKYVELKKVEWEKEYEIAENQGKSMITNNNFMVYDAYYNSKKSKMEHDKNSLKNTNLMNSKEYDDYKLYLDICKDLGIEPFIILMPTNGKWYDFLGLSKQKRDEFYTKVEKISKEKGLEVLNLKDEEYTPYFMCDAAHLGWKGWLKVDEELYKHFKE